MSVFIFGFVLLNFVFNQSFAQTCPKSWIDFKDSCYKFSRAPLKARDEAEEICHTYNADLAAVNNLEEHYFIVNWLRENDPQHRRWYTSGRDDGDNVWVWDTDNTMFTDIDALFLPFQNLTYGRFAAYNYSDLANKWGLIKVDALEVMAFICEIPKDRLNQIIITERDIDYGLLVFDKEKIPRGPYFIQQPESVIFDPSNKQVNYVFLKCVAMGYPNPIYKWYREEFRNDQLDSYLVDPLSDSRYTQTDGTLIISNPSQTKDRGNYHCTAENKYGIIISQTVKLSFGYINEFNKRRSDDSGKENWGKSISCDAPQHYPEVNFYWVRDNFPNFVEEDQRVFVSHDGNLYFSSLEKVDSAYYSCNAQNRIAANGRTGPFFKFNVEPASSGQKLLFPSNFPKVFPKSPLAGDDIRLECVAYGYPVPSYNWTRKGFTNELPKGSYTLSHSRVLVIPKVRVEDVGDYYCTATNGLESITKAVPLDINAKPEFTIPLENKVVDKQSLLVWTCEAFGKPDVKYTWLKNGKELHLSRLDDSDRNRYRIYENVLTIDSVIERDQGMYQCKATNQVGSMYSSGQLRVITLKPSFAKYPLDSEMYAAEGGNITIPCRPEAAPFPSFTWKRDGYGLSTVGRIRILPNGYLVINPVKREDEGRYTCIAKNQYGTDYSEGLLIVLGLPRIVDSPDPVVSAVVNDTTELACEARINSDMLDLAYIWLMNGLRINMNEERFSVGRHPGYLRIYNITLADAGTYHCIVKTAVGRISRSTQLIVIGPPGAPGAVLVEDLTATSGRIHWSDGSANGDPIKAYTIEGYTNHLKKWVVLRENVEKFKYRPESGRREIELFNVLSPYSRYSFRVSAINNLGRGEPSDPSPFYHTDKDVPHVPPSNVGGGGGKTGSLTITWDPLSPQDWNDNEIWYNISYKPADSERKFQEVSLKSRKNIGLHVLNVGEENYYKPYIVKVQAINTIGPGPYSDEVEVYSAENMPQVQPSQVYAVAYNSTALNVTWAPMDLNREKIRGKLIGYRIKYWQNGRDDPTADSLILLKRGLENWGLIVGLQPNTEYYVAVMAYNSAGSGVESEPYLTRTFKAAPLRPPTNVRVEALSPTSVSVSWRGVLVSTEEEPIKGYKVRYWESDEDMTSAKEVYRYLDGNDLQVVVSGLTIGKAYKLRVLAFSNGGDGKMSSPVREFKIGDAITAQYRVSSASTNQVYVLLNGIILLLMYNRRFWIFLFSSGNLPIFKAAGYGVANDAADDFTTV